jgi:AcrR family transcriptional regulator
MVSVKGSKATVKLSRRESARATQWRMVKAAYQLFCDQGYAATTMAQIAEAAGVAIQTLYFTFHTKAALLSRAYDFAVLGDEEPQPPESQDWYRAMAAEPDLVGALRHLVSGVGEITRRATPIELAARVASDADPDTRRVMEIHERWRADGFEGMLAILSAKAPLRSGLTLKRATDLLLLHGGADVYRFLVEERQWTHDDWVDWTTSALAEQLFGAIPGPKV